MSDIQKRLDIAFTDRSAYHEWTKIANEIAREFAEALESGATDLKKRLRLSDVVHPTFGGGMFKQTGRNIAARHVTSGIFRSAESVQGCVYLLAKSFYTYDGLYVPVSVNRTTGAMDHSK